MVDVLVLNDAARDHICGAWRAGGVEQIVAAHPSLTEDGVRAAIEYAARVLRMDAVYPVAGAAR